MTDTRKRISNVDFREPLCTMRKRIGMVPEQHRAILWAAIDKAQDQHERMGMISTQVEDMVADLGLIVEHTRFHVAACRREFHARCPDVPCPL